MNIVVDTSVLIDYLRREDKEKSFFYKLLDEDVLVVSLISVGELYSGSSAQVPFTKRLLSKFLQGLKLQAPNLSQAQKAGYIRQRYGTPLRDAFIAALAIENKHKLATLDVNHFKKIKGLKLYK